MKTRLDQAMVARRLVSTRSQAESWIKLGKVFVNGQAVTKPGFSVSSEAVIELKATEQYVSRAGLKLASIAAALGLNFAGKVMLDVGSSTGGFTDYALRHGAKKVIAVEVGKDQLHPSLRDNPAIELHEQTDILSVRMANEVSRMKRGDQLPHSSFVLLHSVPDVVVIDVSFVSLRALLPHIATLSGPRTQIVAMVKPQFEASVGSLKHKGVIKNDRMRRDILKSFEEWAKQRFVVIDKADSEIAGAKGNVERFYLLQKRSSP